MVVRMLGQTVPGMEEAPEKHVAFWEGVDPRAGPDGSVTPPPPIFSFLCLDHSQQCSVMGVGEIVEDPF